jgi:hypothetical protein
MFMATKVPAAQDWLRALVESPPPAVPATAAPPAPPEPMPPPEPSDAGGSPQPVAAQAGRRWPWSRTPAPAAAPPDDTAKAPDGPATDGTAAKDGPATDGTAATPEGPPPKKKKKRRRRSRWDAPAWVVSVLVHLGVLSVLALAGAGVHQASKAVANLNASMVDTKLSGQQAEELVHILADPSNAPRDQAVGSTITATPGGVGGIGNGPPSATPSIGSGVATVSERTSLPGIKIAVQPSGLALLPVAPARDLGGGGGIAGDVTYETGDVGQALDQLAREILRHLGEHRLTVLWLIDESGSMKDDQQAIKDKFDRVATELKANTDADPKTAGALTHAVVGFGDNIHYDLEKPTADIEVIRRTIDRLRVDETGNEKTMHALVDVIGHYGRLISKDRRLLIVLATDESGDDGEYVEEARQAAVGRGVPIYVIGRQALFGAETAHLLYIDPVTKDQYWPAIRRGPETAGKEALQWDGLHGRWDEQPSGFAPYELARLAKDSGGIYFLLPSEEGMRVRQREKAYSIATLKEYVPDYESRTAYFERIRRSELRTALVEIIGATQGFGFREHFPVAPDQLGEAVLAAGQEAEARLSSLLLIEKKLRSLEKLRDREPEKRWQAAYDLMLAQIVTYQVKAYEYRACLLEMVGLARKGKLRPSQQPTPQLVVEWAIGHSRDRKAPKAETEKKYADAERLLKQVIERHPKTPWADLAQDEIDRGFGCQWGEWQHNPRYDERAKLVPKY